MVSSQARVVAFAKPPERLSCGGRQDPHLAIRLSPAAFLDAKLAHGNLYLEGIGWRTLRAKKGQRTAATLDDEGCSPQELECHAGVGLQLASERWSSDGVELVLGGPFAKAERVLIRFHG